ncbi:MAG: stage II sporulation protein P [Lachnospiraceae bacterium]|nr:stage II sporulation protein P [Lachnospiraceae bacterium]
MQTLLCKSSVKIFGGFITVLILSVSFSGICINLKPINNLIIDILKSNYPMLEFYSLESDRQQLFVEKMIMDGLSLSAKTLDENMPEDVNEFAGKEVVQTVGKRTYSLQDHVVYENEDSKNSDISQVELIDENVENVVNSIENNVVNENKVTTIIADTASTQAMNAKPVISDNSVSMDTIRKLKETNSTNYLLKNFYIVDKTTSVKKSYFNVKKMIEKDFTIKKSTEPQILIYHTHGASEWYKDSNSKDEKERVIGVGDELTDILVSKYGYNVYHDRTSYDMINGKLDRGLAYAKALPALNSILSTYPSIQVIIDLHRDGVADGVDTTTKVNGVSMARVMFFNGLSRSPGGDIEYLKNDNLEDNLAFSLQMKIKAMELYPGLTKPIYLKGYRYNLHLRKRSLLIELGSQNNTLKEAKNSIPLIADVLDKVLSGE